MQTCMNVNQTFGTFDQTLNQFKPTFYFYCIYVFTKRSWRCYIQYHSVTTDNGQERGIFYQMWWWLRVKFNSHALQKIPSTWNVGIKLFQWESCYFFITMSAGYKIWWSIRMALTNLMIVKVWCIQILCGYREMLSAQCI